MFPQTVEGSWVFSEEDENEENGEKRSVLICYGRRWASVSAVSLCFCIGELAGSQYSAQTFIHWILSAQMLTNAKYSLTHIHPLSFSHTHKACSHSWTSSVRHLRKSSFRASGLIWFRMPPSRLDVASEATIKGLTTVGGI